jgi:hypothetical protein
MIALARAFAENYFDVASSTPASLHSWSACLAKQMNCSTHGDMASNCQQLFEHVAAMAKRHAEVATIDLSSDV